MKAISLSTIMTPSVKMVTNEVTVKDVLLQMTEAGLSCLLVGDKEQHPEAIITQQSLLTSIANTEDCNTLFKNPCTKVADEVVTARDSMIVEDAIPLIKKHKAKHLVIVNEHHQLCGLVTHTDLVNSYATMLVDTKEQMELKIQERTQELEAANRKLATMSLIDPLTELGNRRALQTDITKTHAASIRHDHNYSIALVDVDYFKKYNDHYGHQMGDDALKDVAKILKNSIRETDYLYRYNGEEFLILMPETVVEEATIPLKRIIDQMAVSAIPHERSPIGYLTLSAGLASSNPRLIGWREVIELADRRLYDAKENGRNQFHMKEDTGSVKILKSG